MTLLKLALALLIAAQQPNVSPELRSQAIFTAQTAISYAVSMPNSSGLVPSAPSEVSELTQNSPFTGVSFGDQATSAPEPVLTPVEICKQNMGKNTFGTCVGEGDYSGKYPGYGI